MPTLNAYDSTVTILKENERNYDILIQRKEDTYRNSVVSYRFPTRTLCIQAPSDRDNYKDTVNRIYHIFSFFCSYHHVIFVKNAIFHARPHARC